jgi:predicted DNA-binding transcriptional regulator AlpA
MARPKKKAIVKERPQEATEEKQATPAPESERKAEKQPEKPVAQCEIIEDDPLLPKKANLRLDEVMTYFDMSRDTILNFVAHRKLMCLQDRPGAMRRFPRVEVLKFRSYLLNAGRNLAR